MRRFAISAGLIVLLSACCQPAQATILYNGSLGTSPASQGYLTYGTESPTALFSVGPSSITMDSTASAAFHSGFEDYNALLTALQNPSMPALDRAAGFSVSVTMRTISETHTSNDRAGFSLIALSSDHQGVEIAFWAGEVWAQNTNFTKSATEDALFDTTAALTTYTVAVQGSGYTLSENGNPLFSGALRDYSASGAIPNVYALNNFIFFGDDTTSAKGSNEVSNLTLTPEPGSVIFCAVVAGAGLLRRRRG